MENKKSYLLGSLIYFITLSFTALALFLQVFPLTTEVHFEQLFNVSSSKIIDITSSFFIIYAFMQIPNGILFDRFGVKLILPLGLILTIAGQALYLYCSSEAMLSISRVCSGLGCSVAYMSGAYIAMQLFPAKRIPIFIGLLEVAASLGTYLAAKPFYSELIKLGWHNANMLVILFTVGLLVLSLVLLPMLNIDESANPDKTFRHILKDLLEFCKNKPLLGVFAYSFCTWAIGMSFGNVWAKNYLMREHYFSEIKALGLIQVYCLASLVFNILPSLIARNLNQIKIMIKVCALINFIVCIAVVIPPLFHHVNTTLLFTLLGIGTAGMTLSFALIPELVPTSILTTAMATNNASVVFGGYVGSIIFGAMLGIHKVDLLLGRHIHGDPQYYLASSIFLVFSVLSLIALFIATATRKTHIN